MLPMSDAMRPYLVRKSQPAPVAVPLPEPVAPAVVHVERIVEKAAAPAKPSAWRFEVVRGDDNLIIEIIATPIT